jgi:hypothetical protein
MSEAGSPVWGGFNVGSGELVLPECFTSDPVRKQAVMRLIESGQLQPKLLQGVQTAEGALTLVLSILASISTELQFAVQLLSQKDQQLQTFNALKEQLQLLLQNQQRDDAARDAVISSAVAFIRQAQSDLCAAVVAQQAQLALDPAVHQVFLQLQQFLPELRQGQLAPSTAAAGSLRPLQALLLLLSLRPVP